jgi:plasmid stabilization system protein ParE
LPTAARVRVRRKRRTRAAVDKSHPRLTHRNSDNSPLSLAEGLYRIEYESHVIFYRVEPKPLLIVRVLHQRMDFARHSMKDE